MKFKKIFIVGHTHLEFNFFPIKEAEEKIVTGVTENKEESEEIKFGNKLINLKNVVDEIRKILTKDPKDSNSNAAPYLFNKHRQALEYSEGLEEFCLMFEKYISLINKDTLNTYNVDDLTAPYQNSFQKRNKGEDIKLLDISKVDAVFSYNYTDTFDKLFPKLSENSCIYYINGKVLGDFDSIRTESQIVFGYTRDNKKVDVSPKCLIFEKDKQRFLKNIPMYNYNEVLGDKPFNIVIFGHSCSPADGDVFRTIFNNPNLNKAVICCYDKVSMTSAYENLVKLLDESPSCNITINDLIINKKVLFCLNQNSIAKINITTI